MRWVASILAKKGHYFCQMHEHVNFFTPDALKKLFERHGFKLYYNGVNVTEGKLGKSRIISVLCKLS